jgi:peptidoglycan DL-endopeptidase CwlO
VPRSSARRGRAVAAKRLSVVVVAISLVAPLALRTVASADPVSSKRAQAQAIAAQLNSLTIRASQAAEAYDEAQIRLSQVNAALATAQAQFGRTGTQLASAHARVKDLAILSYMQGGAASQLSLLIPTSADQIALRGTYVAAATGSNTDAIDALRAAHAALDQRQADLSAAQAQAQSAVAAAAAAQRDAAAADTEMRATYARAETALGQAVLLQAIQQQAAAEQARVRALLTAGRNLAPRTSRGGRSTASTALAPPSSALPPPSSAAGAAIRFAESQLGKPYMYGGGGPSDYDCSGLTSWAWGHAGHGLPHSSEAQYYDTTHVSVADLQPGDLVFYGMPPHHVGIYVGGGEMINALHSGTNVEYDSIYVESDLIGGGRVN